MSFKIFSQQLFGKIKPTESIENRRKSLLDDFEEFNKVENSDELKKYLELDKWLNSNEFRKKKSEIESLQFKGSKEFNELKELEGLKKSKTIRNYFKVVNSADLKKFNDLKDSEKIKEYDALLEYVKEGQFTKEKEEIKKQVFKGSVEERHLLDFTSLEKSAGIRAYKELHQSEILKKHENFSKSEKLKKYSQLNTEPDADKQKQKELKTLKHDPEIKAYFKFEKSNKLKLYHEIAGSHDLKKYEELKAFVEKGEFKEREKFLKDKKKFEKSEAYKKYSRFKQLAADTDVKFFLKFDKSSLYRNYLDVTGSFDLKRHNELTEIVSSEEFMQRKAYLEDKNKWQKTEEYAKQQEYLSMKKLPHLVKYFSYKGGNAFDFFRKWEVSFEDDFNAAKLDKNKWSDKTYISDKMLGDNYSMAGDLQVYTDGANVKTNGKLAIEVRKEKKTGKVWQVSSGFLPVELDYTSGIVSSWPSFAQEDGIFEAKIKFAPIKQTVGSFYLSGEQNMPRVNLLEAGAKNRVGIISSANGKTNVVGLDISNLKRDQWYIFTVEKEGSNIVWKINESEVFRAQNPFDKEKLHLNASVLVVDEVPGSQLPAAFEVNWVKCYRKI